MLLTSKAISAIVLLSIATLVPLIIKTKSVETTSSEIEARLTETIPIRDKIADFKKQIGQMVEKQTIYDIAIKELIDIPWPKVLQAIGNAVPDKVRIVNISTTDSGEFTILGEAWAERYVYKFIKELQRSELIDYAKIEEIEYDNSSEVIVVDYKINGKVRLSKSDL